LDYKADECFLTEKAKFINKQHFMDSNKSEYLAYLKNVVFFVELLMAFLMSACVNVGRLKVSYKKTLTS
jgi:hypothetical protein